MTIPWIVDGRITAPTLHCAAQGVVQLLGTNIVDWSSTLAISIHTTVVLFAPQEPPPKFAKHLVICVCVIVSLVVGLTLGVRGLDIIGPAGPWCWIQSQHRAEQIVGEYLWLWAILVFTIIAYSIDVLILRGFLTINGWRLRWAIRRRAPLNLTNLTHVDKKMAKELAFYPLIYFVSVTPFSITRWMNFSGIQVPRQAFALTASLFSLSGLFNVILFFTTRPGLFKGNSPGDAPPPDDARPPVSTMNATKGRQTPPFGTRHHTKGRLGSAPREIRLSGPIIREERKFGARPSSWCRGRHHRAHQERSKVHK